MSITSKSPRKVAVVALDIGERSLPTYAHKFSPHKYTLAQLFACLVLKTFWKTDYRGAVAQLIDNPTLCNDLHLEKVPHHTTLQKANRRLLRFKDVREMLGQSYRVMCKRRRQIRRTAADSTGMEAGNLSPYYVKRRAAGAKNMPEPAYQTTTYRHFPKLSLIIDCDTHMILAANPTRGPTPDVNLLAPLMGQCIDGIVIDQMLLDAGYDSQSNHELLRDDHGIRSLIPPTAGRPTTKPATGLYRRLMQQLFQHSDNTNYGQRWQSETVIYMIKHNLGCAIAAKSYWSQNREMLLKALTHNVMICLCLIRELFYRACQEPFSVQ